jgi:hypothetical protein
MGAEKKATRTTGRLKYCVHEDVEPQIDLIPVLHCQQ